MQIMVKLMSWGLVGMVLALPSYFSLQPTYWQNPSVHHVGFFLNMHSCHSYRFIANYLMNWMTLTILSNVPGFPNTCEM